MNLNEQLKEKLNQNLYKQVSINNVDVVETFLQAGANPDYLHDEDYFNVNYETSVLMKATLRGYFEIVELLLKYGANPNILCYGINTLSTPLIEACFYYENDNENNDNQNQNNNYKKIIIKLLEYGAYPNVQDEFGWSPLILASRYGSKDIIKILLKSGSNINLANKYGENVFSFSFKKILKKINIVLILNDY